jgi:hypothetical protein
LRSIETRHSANRLLVAPDEVNDLIGAIVDAEVSRGLDRRAECLRVVAASSRFAGWQYRITRELRERLIDCSTLISQSHWDGAAIATPFVAETQRIAYNASDVPDGQWLPGDVLVRYPSRELSPGGRHNHVALYLGRDASGATWMIESREPQGVRALGVDDRAADGGVRRFLPHPTRAFDDEMSLALARAVPKLGRLGSRLTVALDGESERHRGIDIYFSRPVDVLAPLSGRVTYSTLGRAQRVSTAWITSEDGSDVIVLGPLAVADTSPRHVRSGNKVGRLHVALPEGCNAIPRLMRFPRLHVAYWSCRQQSFHGERSAPPCGGVRRFPLDAHVAYNPLYAMKVGVLAPPISPSDVDAALSLPLPEVAEP